MRKTLNEIRETIIQAADRLQSDAGYGGRHDDGGASKLLSELSFWEAGILSLFETFSVYTVSGDGDMPTKQTIEKLGERRLEVPLAWEKYFLKDNPEYQEYLRLKKKYVNL